MRRFRLLFIVVFQIALLLSIVGKYQYIAASGMSVTLKTAPVDPRDLFSGDYVRLHYEISEINKQHVQQDIADGLDDVPVYVVLEKKTHPWFEAVGVYQQPPRLREGQALLRGTLLYQDEYAGTLHIDYGLNRFYLQENTGREWEQKPFLLVDLRVTESGDAIIERLR
jgi:uncharacterized membrane-anchored protein